MGLRITPKFGQKEYLKVLFLILGRYGKDTGIHVDKGHLQDLPSTWQEELQPVDLGQWWELRRHPQPGAVRTIHRCSKIGFHELFIILYLLLTANNNKVKVRKRHLKNVPDDWMNMLQVDDKGTSWLITIKPLAKKSIIIDPTAVEMP